MASRVDRIRTIAIVAFDGVQLLDVAGPADVFEIASRELLADGAKTAAYRVLLVACTSQVRASCGVRLSADVTIDQIEARSIDTLLVGGGHSAPVVSRMTEVHSFICETGSQVGRVGSVCTGAWLLAAAGLLDGRRATTHWAACQALAEAYPSISVLPDAIFVRDDPVWTSAGITSGIDLALAMVEDDYGRDIALRVARILVAFLKRPGGQSQFSAPLAAQMAERSPVRAAQSFAIEHPGEDLSVEALAKRAAMSPRNFARVFLRETGKTPGEFVEGVRLDTARRLLEDSKLTAEQIARRAGFGEPDTMRRAFLRCLGVTPRDYRARFRTAGQAGDWEHAA